LPVIESDPVRRSGLPWQNRATPMNLLATLRLIVFQPKRSFRRLRIGGSNWIDRLFLLLFAIVVGLLWGVVGQMAGMLRPWWWALWAGVGTLVLTYVEVLGVAYFSRRRGWRVGWWLAERVAAYASPGWVVAAGFLIKLKLLHETGILWGYLPAYWGPLDTFRDLLLGAAAGGLAILWFETLVWLGVRQVRYANG
jgi:hypothetical protein